MKSNKVVQIIIKLFFILLGTGLNVYPSGWAMSVPEQRKSFFQEAFLSFESYHREYLLIGYKITKGWGHPSLRGLAILSISLARTPLGVFSI